MELVDILIECGATIVNPQDLVNGIDDLAREVKGRVCIDLDIDRQKIVPFDTPAEIRDLIGGGRCANWARLALLKTARDQGDAASRVSHTRRDKAPATTFPLSLDWRGDFPPPPLPARERVGVRVMRIASDRTHLDP